MSARPQRASRIPRSAPAADAAAPAYSRRGVVIAAGFAAMLFAAGAVWMLLSLWPQLAEALPVREVRFVSATEEPLSEVDQDALQQVADALQTRFASMLQLDLAALKAVVREQDWVRDATVRRRFPATVVVAIEEHRPAARWQPPAAAEIDGTTGTLVNTRGEVFRATISDERRDRLPLLSGPEGSSAELSARYAQLESAFAAIARRPTTLEMSPRRAWRVVLDDGTALELGRGEIDARIDRFLRAHAIVPVLQAGGGAIDLRYSNGFAVRTVAAGASPAAERPAVERPAVERRRGKPAKNGKTRAA